MTTHLLTPEEWRALSADSRHALERMQARLETIRTLWADLPASFKESLAQYHPAEYAKWRAAMGVEK